MEKRGDIQKIIEGGGLVVIAGRILLQKKSRLSQTLKSKSKITISAIGAKNHSNLYGGFIAIWSPNPSRLKLDSDKLQIWISDRNP